MATDLQQSAGLAHSSTDALQQLQSQQQAAASANRILFLVVVSGADLDCLEDPKPTGPRYTRDSLRNLLQLLGCKPRLAYKVMMGVFQAVDQAVTTARQQRISRKTFQVHPHRNGKVYVSLTRADFMSLVSSCAAQYSYKISPSSEELKVACSLRERRRCVVVLLCGTSGSGKSTLASILASRLGITTVVSTDSIRHMMRSFISKEQAPLLWASTYQAGEQLGDSDKAKKATSESELAVYGYKAQCDLLSEHLELLIAGCEARTQSLICEGVHLNISTVAKLMARHPSVLPFLVFIPSESRHVERMAVRAKYMTLDPNKNRYVRYMGNIRLIQEYLVRKADKYAVPRVDNSNVDRSVGIIHLTVMSCLRRMARGEPVLDPATGKTTMLAAEYAAVLDHLQGEKDRLAAATAAANTSSSSSATNQKQQLHHLRDAVGLGQQQQEAGGSSGGGRGHGKTTGLERHNPQQQQQQPPQQQQRVGMQTNGSLRQSQAGPDQHPAPHAAAAMAGIPPIAEQVPGSASTYCSRQGGAGGAAVGALVAAAAVTAPSQQEQADVAGTTSRSGPIGSLPDGQEQQQGRHSSSSGELHGSHHATSSPGVGAEAGSSVEAHAGHTISSPVRSGCMLRGATPDGQHQQHQDGQAQQVAAACAQAAQSLQQRGSQDSSGALRDGIQPHGPAQQQQDQHQEHQHTMWGPAAAQQPSPGRSSGGSSGRASSDAAGGSAVHTAELGGSTRGSSSSSSRDGHVQDGHSCGDAVAGVSSSRGSFDQQEQGDVHYEQQQQEWGQREEAEEDDEDAGLVSSGEELDRLGELGSSDNEGERFIQEYGSVYESTTCDEHDDYDEAGGLRAWHTGMATALWPSYAHVYAPNTAAASSSSGGLVLPHAAVTAGDLLPTGSARAGAAARALRATHSEFGGGSAAAAAGSSGAAAALAGSSAGLRGLHALLPSDAGAAMGASRGHSMMLPTVYESQQSQQPQQQQGPGQEGLGRPPLPVHTAGGRPAGAPQSSGADSTTSSSSAAASSSGGGRVATMHTMAGARGGMGRVVFRSRSTNSLHHSGRHRPRSAGSTSSSGGSNTAATAAVLRPWSAGAEGRASLEAHAASLGPVQASSEALAVAEQPQSQKGG